MIKFAYTILYVADVEKTIIFYEQAFGFTRKLIIPGGEYGELRKAVAAGAIAVEKAAVKPWGQPVAYVRDPDGFLIEICTPMN